MYLAHRHNGLDIEIKTAVETLKNVYKVWQRPIHLQAKIDDDMIRVITAYEVPEPRAKGRKRKRK